MLLKEEKQRSLFDRRMLEKGTLRQRLVDCQQPHRGLSEGFIIVSNELERTV